jgi:hypothetical protein
VVTVDRVAQIKNAYQIHGILRSFSAVKHQGDGLHLTLTQKTKRRLEIIIMIEGIGVGLLLVGPGKLATPAIAQSICLSRFHLFCVTGLVLVGLALSSAAELVSTNFDAAVGYGSSDRDTAAVVATHVAEYDQGPWEGETLRIKPNRKVSQRDTTPTPGVGVELVCGLALFLSVQRFRNSLV